MLKKAMKIMPNRAVFMKNLAKTYDGKRKVLDSLDWEVDTGEFVSILGQSGTGKSTLLNILGLLDDRTGGSYYLFGNLITNTTNKQSAVLRNKYIGFVFQLYFLIPHLTIKQNLLTPFLYSTSYLSTNEIEKRIDILLDKTGLTELKNCKIDILSGGEKQRVAIARALVTQPKMLIADEPTGNLDEPNAIKIMSILKEFHQEGNTVIMVTHNKAMANYSDKQYTINKGRLE